ncbi:LOW QUALITY PROTEIN: F-box/WD repeat-containing protein 12 [Spheniscus humboldti]
MILSNMLSKGHGIFPGVLSSTSLNTLLNGACGESNLSVLFNDVLFFKFYFTVGKTVVMAYLSDNEQFAAGKLGSLACTASTDGTVTAWKGQEVRKYVSSHVFRIQAWQGDSGEQLAAFSTSPPSCSLAAHSVNNKPFLAHQKYHMGATAGGAAYALKIPDVNRVGGRLDTEAQRKTNGCLPGVFSLTERAPQVSGFPLPARFQSTPSCMEGHRTVIILLGCGSALKLYSIFGALLECFQDHHDTITSIWVDSCRVVTSSLDPSLKYMWKKANKSCALLSRYHLRGGAHR